MELIITIRCGRCEGTGIDNNVIPAIPCVKCAGSGKFESGKLDVSPLEVILNDIKDKVIDIKEKVDEIKKVVDEL